MTTVEDRPATAHEGAVRTLLRMRVREGCEQRFEDDIARLLAEELPDAPYTCTMVLVDGWFACLEWTADTEQARVRDGADSFVIEDGWIVAQTIHDTVGKV